MHERLTLTRSSTLAALAAGLLTLFVAPHADAADPVVATAPADAPPAVPPAGMWVTCTQGPNTGAASSTCPVLKWNGYTYWAYSYFDNRMAMGIVAYDGSTVVGQWEMPNARYVHAITVDSAARTVTFAGQSDKKITMTWDALTPSPVVAQATPAQQPPAGMWFSCKKGPVDMTETDTCPVIKWNGLTYWAFSYFDNRVGMAIVAYDANGKVVRQMERSGARYLHAITVDKNARTVTFAGQSNQKISVAWNDLLGTTPRDWTKVATPANVTFKQVSVGSAAHVWAVDTQGSPWRWTGTTWEKKVGKVASLSVDASGVVWGLIANDEIWMWRGGPDWVRGVGTLRSVSAVDSDVVWGVQANGGTFRWDPAVKNWTKIATPANVTFKQISAGSAAHVWAVDTQGSPWRWTGSTWEKKNGTVASLDVDPSGTVWGLVANDEVWLWQGGPSWTRGVGTLRSVSAASGDVVWGVQANGGTFRWGP